MPSQADEKRTVVPVGEGNKTAAAAAVAGVARDYDGSADQQKKQGNQVNGSGFSADRSLYRYIQDSPIICRPRLLAVKKERTKVLLDSLEVEFRQREVVRVMI